MSEVHSYTKVTIVDDDGDWITVERSGGKLPQLVAKQAGRRESTINLSDDARAALIAALDTMDIEPEATPDGSERA